MFNRKHFRRERFGRIFRRNRHDLLEQNRTAVVLFIDNMHGGAAVLRAARVREQPIVRHVVHRRTCDGGAAADIPARLLALNPGRLQESVRHDMGDSLTVF